MFLSFMSIYMPNIKVRCWSIKEILMIKEYWNLIDQGTFLTITWEPDFNQPCSFHRMLMNYNNCGFTPISDKTNNIFLKSPKTLFLGHFLPFLVIFAWWEFLSKNLALSRIIIYGPPNTMLSLSQWACNYWANSKKSYRQAKRTNSRIDRQTPLHRTFPAMARRLKRGFAAVQKQYPVDLYQ